MTDFRENMKKNLERYEENKKFNCLINFKALLKEFEKNPKQYSKIVIRTDFVEAKSGYKKRTEFDGSEAIKEHYDEILEAMISLSFKYDISDCIEDSKPVKKIINERGINRSLISKEFIRVFLGEIVDLEGKAMNKKYD